MDRPSTVIKEVGRKLFAIILARNTSKTNRTYASYNYIENYNIRTFSTVNYTRVHSAVRLIIRTFTRGAEAASIHTTCKQRYKMSFLLANQTHANVFGTVRGFFIIHRRSKTVKMFIK